jgi:hypothetical protein
MPSDLVNVAFPHRATQAFDCVPRVGEFDINEISGTLFSHEMGVVSWL